MRTRYALGRQPCLTGHGLPHTQGGFPMSVSSVGSLGGGGRGGKRGAPAASRAHSQGPNLAKGVVPH